MASFASEAAAEQDDETVPDAGGVTAAPQLTMMGSMMGTPDYIAPEQAEDAHSADIRSDICSFGYTLYCLLTGQPPFPSGSTLDKVMAHIEREMKPVGEFRGDVPAGVVHVLEK